MRTHAPISAILDTIKPGRYWFWSLLMPPAHPLEIVLERNPGKTSLWARLTYDCKHIVLHVDDVLSCARQAGPNERVVLPFVWRGRSTRCGTVVIEDDKLVGSLDVVAHVAGVDPPRDVQFYLGGSSMGREGYVEARRDGDLDRDESVLVEDIKRSWEEMEKDENKADMEYAREHWGAIRRVGHGEL